MAGSDPITAVSNLLDDAANKIWPDASERVKQQAALTQKIIDVFAQGDASQVAVNTAEAQNPHVFVAGWRPALGWILDVALACYFIPRFVALTAIWIWACLHQGVLVPPPSMDVTEVTTLMGILLGNAGMRSLDKYLGTGTIAFKQK